MKKEKGLLAVYIRKIQIRMETKFPHAFDPFADFKKRGGHIYIFIWVVLVKVTVLVFINYLLALCLFVSF